MEEILSEAVLLQVVLPTSQQDRVISITCNQYSKVIPSVGSSVPLSCLMDFIT